MYFFMFILFCFEGVCFCILLHSHFFIVYNYYFIIFNRFFLLIIYFCFSFNYYYFFIFFILGQIKDKNLLKLRWSESNRLSKKKKNVRRGSMHQLVTGFWDVYWSSHMTPEQSLSFSLNYSVITFWLNIKKSKINKFMAKLFTKRTII